MSYNVPYTIKRVKLCVSESFDGKMHNRNIHQYRLFLLKPILNYSGISLEYKLHWLIYVCDQMMLS